MRLTILLISLLLPLSAYAYFDLGTGSYIFQIVLASFFGILYTIRSYLSALVRKVFGKKKVSSTEILPDSSTTKEDNL